MVTEMPIGMPSFFGVDCERGTGEDVWLEVGLGVCRDVELGVEDALAAGEREVELRRLEAVTVALLMGGMVNAGLEAKMHNEGNLLM